MNILKINPAHPEPDLLNQAAGIILRGGVIGYPTETVYGLGANAYNSSAISKVFELKAREATKPILVIAGNTEMVKKLITSFPESAARLAGVFWPGPLTMVLEASAHLSESLLGGGNRIGIRIPGNQICLELLKRCGVPITSTSANISGQRNPISAMEVFENFGDHLDLIIDGGVAPSRVPSTVIGFEDDEVTLIREGAISKITIEQAIGRKMNES
jgi:L-threonylcarbamoyladenylate synthase